MYFSTGAHHHLASHRQRSRYAVMTFLIVQLGVLEMIWYVSAGRWMVMGWLVSLLEKVL